MVSPKQNNRITLSNTPEMFGKEARRMIKAGTWEAKALFIHDSYNCEHREAMCSKTLAKDKS